MQLKLFLLGSLIRQDADYGYVGKGVGTIALYRNRDEIKRVPEDEGVQALVDLIKEDGKWVDP